MNKDTNSIHNENFQTSAVINNSISNEDSQWLNGNKNLGMAPQSTNIGNPEQDSEMDTEDINNQVINEVDTEEPTLERFRVHSKPNDIIELRNTIFKWKSCKLSDTRESYNEDLIELFYLNNNNNMLDIINWKKRPPEDVIEFCKRRRLEGDTFIEKSLVPICVPSTQVKAAPEAVAGNSESKMNKVTIIQNSDSGTPGGNQQEQILEKAKHEAYVLQRIGILRKEGLWTEKRLPKVQEPPRLKTHWDYLLEEMVWLSADFAQERKWKKAAAKKCAKMVQKYFQDKALHAQRAEREQEMKLRKLAAFAAKEIRTFWGNIGKIVEYKVNTRLDEKKKKALDQHLNFIVDQTEKYSTMLAESMQKPVEKAHSINSDTASRNSSLSDGEFEPDGPSDDDEATIAKEEDNPEEQASELQLLQKESEQTLEDILNILPQEYFNQTPTSLAENLCLTPDTSNMDEDDCLDSNLLEEDDPGIDDDFKADESEEDVEDTIQEQERMEIDNDYAAEIKELEDENEMSIEDLRKKYQGLSEELMDSESQLETSENQSLESLVTPTENLPQENAKLDSDDEDVENTDDESSDNMELADLMEQHFDPSTSEEPSKEKSDQADKELENAAAVAESLQPKGFTLSSTSVTTPVPFLLKHTLREYQHVGLDWLVTMYEKKLNGILADEMGLGKTIQTISLLAHLATEKECWGPHLIVVPTSVMLNWEMELKKWCPAFKILTYYGSQKERKLKRQGWTKPNAFHVCITSYKLVIQDHQSFRRKKWKYFILDEAQNIKNFKSQRWQLLLNFQTQRRLLLTGTPLQNNLMELWSLMHFLMPNIFASHREFREWFSNPVTGMIEGNKEYNDNIIRRLHKVLRPFILRRLKCEVEQQMPKKFEHIIMCRLSKRQRFLYEEFMSRTKTKETLSSGNFLSVINILMQLRKVCNHPNLFEPRPTISPFMMEPISCEIPSLVWSACAYDPFKHVDLFCMNLLLKQLEFCLTAFAAHRIRRFQTPNKLIEEIDSMSEPPPKCPAGKIKLHVRPSSQSVPRPQGSGQRPATPVLTVKQVSNSTGSPNIANASQWPPGVRFQLIQYGGSYKAIPLAPGSTGGMIMQQTAQGPRLVVPQRGPQTSPQSSASVNSTQTSATSGSLQLVQTSSGQLLLTSSPSGKSTSTTTSIGVTGSTAVALLQRLQNIKGLQGSVLTTGAGGRPVLRLPTATAVRPNAPLTNSITTTAGTTPTSNVKFSTPPQSSTGSSRPVSSGNASQPSSSQSSSVQSPTKIMHTRSQSNDLKDMWPAKTKTEASKSIFYMHEMDANIQKRRKSKLKFLAQQNSRHCHACPIYGSDLVEAVSVTLNDLKSAAIKNGSFQGQGLIHCRFAHKQSIREYWEWTSHLQDLVYTPAERIVKLDSILKNFVFCVPSVVAPRVQVRVPHPPPSMLWAEQCREVALAKELSPRTAPLHPITISTVTQFPDPRLIQYDCGKLQILDKLLRQLKTGGHRVLIFTQMTRMLDVFEMFLNYHGHLYLRLDGTTKVDQRQTLMERFNQDKRIFVFILSTRSGGIGVNLTGADTVIFYDSDWNPTMDAQAQDRCHRIGQTRDVHIYRLISEKTIEENILKKANQKRLLGDLAIEGGNFTTASLKKQTIHDLFDVDAHEQDANKRMSEVLGKPSNEEETSEADGEHIKMGAYESALAAAEDDTDVQAAKTAKAEAAADLAEFDENIPLDEFEGVEELSKAEQEVNLIMKQLNPIEKYALQFLEKSDESLTAQEEKLSAEIELQKKEWEQNRLQAMKEEEERLQVLKDDVLLSYSASEARDKIWISDDSPEMMVMPIFEPLTPPRDDNDLYIEDSSFWYEATPMSEAELPPVFMQKDINKRIRMEPDLVEGSQALDQKSLQKLRRDDSVVIPRTLFDRPHAAMLRQRRDARIQQDQKALQYSLRMSQNQGKSVDGDIYKWFLQDDMTIHSVVFQFLNGSSAQSLPRPGHTLNWDLCADLVNSTSHYYRSMRMCRARWENIIQPREEKRENIEPPRKTQKKTKGSLAVRSHGNHAGTVDLYKQDNNREFNAMMMAKLALLKEITCKKTPTSKPMFFNNNPKSPKHASVISEFGINYDEPLDPVAVAVNRSERILREKKNQLPDPRMLGQPQVRAQSHIPQSVVAAAPAQQVLNQNPGKVTASVVLNTASGSAVVSAINASNASNIIVSSPLVTTAITNSFMGNVRTTTAQGSNILGRTLTLQDIQNRTATSQATVVSLGQLHPSKLASPSASQRGVTVPLPARTLTPQQLQYLKTHHRSQLAVQTGKVVATSSAGETQTIKRLQLTGQSGNGQKLQVAAVSGGNLSNITAIQVSQSGGRAQLIKPGSMAAGNIAAASTSGLQAKAGVRSDTDVSALIRRNNPANKGPFTQMFATSKGRPLSKANVALQLSGKGGNVGTLQIVQGTSQKHMTMQQFQQVLKNIPQNLVQGTVSGTLISKAAGSSSALQNQASGSVQATLSSTPSAKFIPVSLSGQQQGIKQTIQVVSASGSNSGNVTSSMRTVAGDRPTGISLQGSTVRVANPALLSAALQGPVPVRSTNNPVRIQTTSLSQQQAASLANSAHLQQQQQQQQQNTQQQQNQSQQ